MFVEVGACYFNNLDALLLDGWTGYFIEPVPLNMLKLIDKVNKNAGDKKINAIFETSAISSYNGIGKFNYVEHPRMAWWVSGIGHVASNTVHPAYLKDRGEGAEGADFLFNNTHEITTQFNTLDTFIEKYSIDSIEIMKIDVEGHELDILDNFSWKLKPRHLKIEHMICGLDPLKKILDEQGYTYTYDDEDVFAFYDGTK